MLRKIIIFFTGFTVFLLVLLAILYVVYLKAEKAKLGGTVRGPSPTPVVEEKLTTWKDQSEFSFQYPESLTLNPHEEDQVNYAHVELTSSSHPGKLILWTKDTTAKDVSDFIKKEKITGAIDSSLGGEQAKKILSGENQQTLTLTVVRNGYLYQIETQLTDRDYWLKIFDTVVNSYTFENGGVTKSQNQTGEDEGTIITSQDEVLEEEVIE